MNTTRAGYLTLFAISLLAAAQMGYYGPKLPPRVVSSFDFHGNPGDSMNKTPFVLLQVGVVLTMLGIAPLARLAMRCSPPSLISLPNKDYWLAPQRRRETARAVETYLVWLAAATVLLLMGMFQLACLANLGRPHAMRQLPLWLTGAYMAFLLFWLVAFYRRFRRPREAPVEADLSRPGRNR